jgi:pimeloyl-ACP methyl ester carboxylesterase
MPSVPAHKASIYYEVHGSGPSVIVLAHGVAGNTLSWFQQVPYFTQTYRVLLFDHRGFGRSTCDEDAQHIGYFAQDLRAVLDAEGVDRAALVGHSVGGFTVLRSAIEFPARVSCVVLLSTAGGLLTPRLLREWTGSAERFAQEEAWWNRLLAPDFAAREPERAFLHTQIYTLNPPIGPSMLAQAVDAQVRPEELTAYTTPTLLLAGEFETFGPEVMREATEVIPGLKTLEIRGVGNSAHFEAPDLFNHVVGDFIVQHAGN